MTAPAPDDIPEPDDALVDRAIATILAEPAPAEARDRAIQSAVALASRRPGPSIRRKLQRLAALTIAVSALFVTYSGYRLISREDAVAPAAARTEALTQQESEEGRHKLSVTDELQLTTHFLPVPTVFPVASDQAEVLVCQGPAHPVELGDLVASREILQAGTHGNVELHVWEWSKQSISRVVAAEGVYRGARGADVTPDGRQLVQPNGVAIDLQSGKSRQMEGFELPGDQRAERVRVAPDGQHVALMIAREDAESRVQQWTLRTVNIPTGEVASEVPCGPGEWFDWVAFTPDNQSLICADVDNIVTSYAVRTGKPQRKYLPALPPNGPVGNAVSSDGRTVTAAHYYGEQLFWDFETARLQTQHLYERPNGERDTFWQAKILRFSPDNRMLAVSSSNRLQVLETTSGEVLARHDEALPAYVLQLRWSEDCQTITAITSTAIAWSPGNTSQTPDMDLFPDVFDWEWQTGTLRRRYADAKEQK